MSRGVNGYGSSFNGECPPPPPAPPMQIHCTSLKLTPTRDGQWKKGPVTYNGVTRSFDETDSGPTISDLSGAQNEPSTLVASIKGESVGAGNCRLYASLPRKTSAGSKVTGDPQVNKLVYNMYRELLNTKHQRASNIVNSAPQEKVATDEGVSDRVISMMRQQTEPKRSKMETAPGPPPPPPPPPFQAAVDSAARPPPPAVESTPVVAMRALHKGPPAALAGAMMKDKKPFTYTPGGIDLSEIKSPRMQRRLQKNAASEGVQLSPLAQQTPPSPTTPGAAPPLPIQGMVQVLPIPGVAMAPSPMKKPKAVKEPPKPKRNVCGPPPPPPPFSISSSSADPSPSPTPYDSPSSTPAMNSTTSPSTPAEVVQPPVYPATPPSTLPSASSTSSTPVTPIENGPPLQPVMAHEPGPSANSVPQPPPLPPSIQKRDPHKEVQPPRIEPPVKPKLPPTTTPTLEFTEDEIHEADIKELRDLTSEINEAIKELKQNSVSPSPAVERQEEPTATEENEEKPVENEATEKELSKSPRSTTPRSHESRWGLKDSDTQDEIEENKEVSMGGTETKSPIARKTEEIKQGQFLNSGKRLSNQFETVSTDPGTQQIPTDEQQKSENSQKETICKSPSPNKPIKIENIQKQEPSKSPSPIKAMKFDSLQKQNQSKTPTPVENSRHEMIQKEFHNKSPTPKPSKHEHLEEEKHNFTPPPVRTLPPAPPSSICSKDKQEHHEIETSQDSETNQRNRPWLRMPSPPIRTPKISNQTKEQRMIRQASLPAQPSSPPSLPTANAGTLYIPPIKDAPNMTTADGSATTPSSSGKLESASPLDKGPLPWMRAHRKEPSPPPEFLVQAQKTQERLQRQRSLTSEKTRKSEAFNEPIMIQKPAGYQSTPTSMPPYSETQSGMVIPPPDIFKDQTHVFQDQWRSPQAAVQRPEAHKAMRSPPQMHQQQTQKPNPFFQGYQNQIQTQTERPRERIIPIMLEGTPPTTPVQNIPRHPGYNTMSPHPHPAERQVSWPKTAQNPYHTLPHYGTNYPTPQGVDDPSAVNSSSNALEALQQMQQNLAQLNTGLQTAQPPPKQNGGTAYTIPSQMAANYTNPPVTADGHPMQSRSFKVIQNAYDSQDPTNTSEAQPEPIRTYTGSNIPSRSFKILQAMTDNETYQPGHTDL